MFCVCISGYVCEFYARAAVISPTQPILTLKLLQANTAEHHTATRGPLFQIEIVKAHIESHSIFYLKFIILLKQGSSE